MSDDRRCTGCLMFEYQRTRFGWRKPPEMFGWCRAQDREVESFDVCDDYASKADQEGAYLARVTAPKPQR